MSQASFTSESKTNYLVLPILIVCAVITGWLTVKIGVGIPAAFIGLISVFLYFIAVFKEPKIAITTCVFYSFIFVFFIREVAPLQFMYVIELLLILSWLAAVMHNSKQYNWTLMKNDLVTWGIIWVFYNFAELANPQAGSIMGWLVDVRYPLWWLMIIPLCMVVFNSERDLNKFINILIFVSLMASFFGMRQLSGNYLPGERAFLDGPDGATHLLFGKLRVFSFMSDAGEFGASQAQMATIAFIMALAPIKPWKRALFFIATFILLDGMFISGTRGAFFTLLSGFGVALIINKNIKVLTIGIVVVGILVGGLKFTSIGSGVYAINRMRTALDPQDASFNVRLNNQKKLHDYLATRPFGAGVGAMGYGARQFNKGTYIGSIPCDSYWVLVWGMYGIVGFILWMSSMMYILGKSCGIVWNIKNEKLRFKLTALTAGSAGIFFSSYGNEVMNFTPSSVVLYVSWAFIFLGPRLDVNHPSLCTHKSILYPNHDNV